jgi:drug/metabolite transporter (DMT)-like permease
VLALIAGRRPRAGSWSAAALLFTYAVTFSFAYLRLGAGTGALLLFGAVQVTMITVALVRGHAPSALEGLGLVLALAGLIALTRPGLTAPDPVAALLMTAAGAAWGGYSVLGATAGDPVAATAGNFLRAAPMACGVSLLLLGDVHVEGVGAALAVASGALASGLGYCFWYAALRGLAPVQAAIAQLSVPLLAALGGVLLLGEMLTARLILCGAVILAGVLLAIVGRRR